MSDVFHLAFSCGEGGNSSRSEAGTDRGDIRWLVQDFIRSVNFIKRATRESPLLVWWVMRYGTENEVKSAFMCHPERSGAKSNP